MILERVDVACYDGYKAHERPRTFVFRGWRWEVSEIIDRWYEGGREAGGPSLDYFKVRTREGPVFLLRYNALFDGWAIVVPDNKTDSDLLS
ncbi:MAG: hypothetical protein JRD89_11925 [Deltaproteobacteria bacterium]|nr:hypothetical protein [Deltaproteobacteria bacterium]